VITMRMLNRQSGMTLMEVLVAVLVLSVGLLGIAGLQVQGTRHAYDAQLHTLAVFQAQDMADRMRSNMAGVRAGDYNSRSDTPSSPPSCGSSTCTAAELADYDVYRWNTDNASFLPSGAGDISCDDPSGTALGNGSEAAIGSRCTITVRWDADRNGATGTGCDPTKDTDLRCMRITFMP
jgi:type IV pilus assembly protein PilV